LKISLEDVRSSPKQRIRIDFKESFPDSLAVKPAAGVLIVSASSAHAQVTGQIQTILKLLCHSCLTPFFQALDLELNEHFVYEDYLNEAEQTAHERELLKEDFVESVPYLGAIDISDIVYQAIILATPSFCSCGKECPGPPRKVQEPLNPSNSGKNDVKSYDAIDPRWQNLKTLFAKDDLSEK